MAAPTSGVAAPRGQRHIRAHSEDFIQNSKFSFIHNNNSRLLCSPNEDSRHTSDESFSLCSDESWIGVGGMSGLSGDLGVDEVYIRVKKREEMHLWPLKEDLADWLNTVLDTSDITADNFMSKLDNGVVVCRLARLIQMRAQQIEQETPTTKTNIPPFDFKCWPDAKKSSFFARDNTENFLKWCRKLRINEAIMFESDDLVLHSQPKNVLLCLLELGRIASRLGIEAPGLVELEKEIEREERRIREQEQLELQMRMEMANEQKRREDTKRGAECELLATSRDITPTPDGASIANSIESHDSGVDETDGDLRAQGTPARERSLLDAKSSLASESGESNPDSLGRSLQSSPNGSVGDLSRCSTPSSTGVGHGDKRNGRMSSVSKVPKSLIPVPESGHSSVKKWIPGGAGAGNPAKTSSSMQALKFDRHSKDGLTMPRSTSANSLRDDGGCAADEHKENALSNGKPLKSGPSPSSNATLSKDAAGVGAVEVQLSTLSCASVNEVETAEESADVLDAKVRHITQKVAEKARRIEERRRDVDERLSVQEPIEREEIPLVERVSEGRYLIGGRIYFVRLLKEKHVMIRVGGGWDTLEHFLSRHDTMNVVYMKRNTRSKSFQNAAAIYEGSCSMPLKSNQFESDWKESNWSINSLGSQARSDKNDRSLTPNLKGESRPRYRSAHSAPLQRTQPFLAQATSCRSSAICLFDTK